MKKRMFLLVILFILALGYEADAANYYMKPTGNDASAGTSTGTAWITMARAATSMVAGDTLFIMGGTYTGTQYFYKTSGVAGTVGYPMVFKAYGDSKAIFQHSKNNGRQDSKFWTFYYGQDWIVIDGFSHLNPADSLYLKLECREDASYVIEFTGTVANNCEHIKIRGIEMDGDFPPTGATYAHGGLLRYGIGFVYCSMDTIESCYLHDAYHATGDIPPGDNTDYAQGTGELIYIHSSQRILIWKNTLGNSNHAALSVGKIGNTDSSPTSRYIKTMYNICDNSWGGGLYYDQNVDYSLFEGNVIIHGGETTNKTKGPLYFAGPHNTARKNVTYSTHAEAFDNSGGNFGTTCFRSDSNMVYNNTFFHSGGNSIKLLTNNTNGDYGCAGASVVDAVFANNILYRSTGVTPDVDGHYSEIKLYLRDANNTHNWVNPDVAGTLPSSTHFGGNEFYNNLIRKDGHDETWDQTIVYTQQASLGSTLHWSLAQIEALDPIAWHNNIGLNPLLSSEYPDVYGLYNGWWELQAASPCVDAGAAINDTIGAHVNSLYPGYGWGNLTYYGSAPDIGADEYQFDTYPICNVSPTSITFGTYVIGDSSAVDSFQISNSGDGWLSGQITLSNYVDFSIVRNGGDFSIAPGDSRWVVVLFNPQNGGLLSCTIEIAEGFCSDVTVTGGSCFVYPPDFNFGNVRVGDCSSIQTITIQNTGTGTGTIDGIISGVDSNFTITEGDGEFSLSASQTRDIKVRFCPLSSGTKRFAIHLGAFFGIQNVGFVAGKTTVSTNFTTTESATCIVYGGLYNPLYPENTIFDLWYIGSTLHGVTHIHTKTDLAVGTLYAIRVYTRNAAGDVDWSPNVNEYYIVSTADESGSGGGSRGTNPEPYKPDGE
jgi:hypothetical protein